MSRHRLAWHVITDDVGKYNDTRVVGDTVGFLY